MIGEDRQPGTNPQAEQCVIRQADPPVQQMMRVHGELRDTARLRHQCALFEVRERILNLVNDVVAQEDIRHGILEREVLTPRR